MRKWNKLLSLLLAMVMAFGMTAVALADEETGAAEDASAETGKIVILHTNDVHCGVDQVVDEEGTVTQIGYTGVAAYKAAMEAQYGEENVTLVDAGDHIQGDLIGSMTKGEAPVRMMNAAGYDLAILGNHEFDYGIENMLHLINDVAEFPYLSCNFVSLEDNEPLLDGYLVLTYGDVKVGYVGIATPQTFTSSTPTYFQDEDGSYIYGFSQDADQAGTTLCEVVQKNVDAARAEGADYVVAVAHLGVDAPYTSASVIASTTGIDAMIDGHSHSVVSETAPNKDGKEVVLAQTGTKLANIGKIVIDTETGEITSELINNYAETNDAVDAVVGDMKAELEEITGKIVAKTDVLLTINEADGTTRAVRNQETNMGDLCADAYRIMLDTDIALIQGGGVRVDIPAGDISNGAIIAVNPWSNPLCIKAVTGQNILDCLEMGARNCPEESGGFMQVSGLSYTIHLDIPSSVTVNEYGEFVSVDGEYRVTDVMVGDEPLDLEKTYTVASTKYILMETGDGMSMFNDSEVILENGGIDNDILIAYITEKLGGTVGGEYAEPQGRITRAGEPAAPAEEPKEEPETPAALFSDVTESNWHYEFVKKMVDAGVVGGYEDGSFKPGNQVTWGEALKMVMLYAGYEEQAPVEGGTWASGYIAKAVEDGLTEAEAEQNKNITRVEMCQLVAKAMKIAASEAESTFSDTDDAYVIALAEAGVVNGYEDGTFNPDGELTRAELCKILATVVKGEDEPAEPAEPAAYIESEISIEVPEQENVPAHTMTAIVTVPTGAEAPVPGVVMLHGTGSNLHEVNGAYDMAAVEMAKNGIASIRFNFMGIDEGKEEEYAGYSYISANVDAKAAADYLAALDTVNGDALGVMGWSQGGTNALLAAAAYPETFKSVVTWAGALDLASLIEDFAAAAAEAKENGFWTMEFDWRTALPFGSQWFEDVANTDVLEKVKEITAPILTINGENDDVVDPASGKAIVEAAQNELSENVMIPECDHTLNMFTESLDAINSVITATSDFFTETLVVEAAEPAQAA